MDGETNQTSGRSSASKIKREPSNNQSDSSKEDVKLKQEDTLSSNVSEASTMVLDNDSDNEKLAVKRSKTAALLVSKFPKNFFFEQIKEYLEKLCEPCEIRDFKNNDDSISVRVIFKNVQQMVAARKILSSESIEGTNLYVTDADVISMEQDEEPPVKRKKEEDEGPWGLDSDVWRTDPKGLYGVKPEYLNTLGVNDTLRNWVLVLNFRCGKEELREVMELAGTVLVCSVHNRRLSHNANVMYSHPLEALQAISMLNGQMLYGRPLTVKMLKSNGVILPKGLTNLGPGLAKYGKPLRDIVRHYERFVKGQPCGLNTNLFRTPTDQATEEAQNMLEDEDSKKRAKIVMQNLISEGININDLVLALNEIIAETKDEKKEALTTAIDDYDDNTSRSDDNLVVIRCNSSEGNSNSPDNDVKKTVVPNANSKTAQIVSLSSLPSSDSGSIPTFPSSNTQSVRSTPSPSSSRPPRPGNPVRPIGSSSQTSSGSSSSLGLVSVNSTMPNLCSQIFPPNNGNIGNPMPIRPTNQMYGQNLMMSAPKQFAPMPGRMASPISRPMASPISRPVVGGMSRPPSGPMPGPMAGQMSGQMSGPMSGPNGPMSGPVRMMSGHGGPMPGPNFSMPGPNTHPPFGPTVHPTVGSGATLQFSNLPPSTTFALLSDKLAQIGQLVSIQFTVPGCVVAKYAHRSHAEMCIKQFNKTCLDGNIIDVRFI